MNHPFDAGDWVPSKPWDVWEAPYERAEISQLISQLQKDTDSITRCPYDARRWAHRAETLDRLRYPELAAGDAHKTRLLCQSLWRGLEDTRWPTARIGYGMGFWMRDEDADLSAVEGEREMRLKDLTALLARADGVLARNLDFYPVEEGQYIPLSYPWAEKAHRMRSDEVLRVINAEMAGPERGVAGVPACEVRRYAFGRGVGAWDGEDLLGVFATRDIEMDELILVDKSKTWGCNHPGEDKSMAHLSNGSGYLEAPPSNTDATCIDLAWVRDRTSGTDAATTIQTCRFLLCAIEDGAAHPLSHHLTARLTATYRGSEPHHFSVEKDIATVCRALTLFGIDIFANLAFDTWVTFTLAARTDNNAWSSPAATAVNPLFSLFNHSCDPNVQWTSRRDHRSVAVSACRRVRTGEQLFVEYDGYVRDEPLRSRRRRLGRWLDGPCQCSRCVREESEAEAEGEAVGGDGSSTGGWDSEEKPVFPEDGIGRGDGWVGGPW